MDRLLGSPWISYIPTKLQSVTDRYRACAGVNPRSRQRREKEDGMQDDGSVTSWLGALRNQDSEAARRLWQRYFKRLQGLARKQLGPQPRTHFDSEDVALSAFDAFCRAMHDGRYPDLGRDELWPLLAQIAIRKVQNRQQKDQALKRAAATQQDVVLDELCDKTPPPDFEAMMAEECQRLLELLGDPALVQVAVGKLDGWTNEELAAEMNYTRRTIQRMLDAIRTRWQVELAT